MAKKQFCFPRIVALSKGVGTNGKTSQTKLRMLILYYQRLYLNFPFFKVANENPLLAILASKILSKPITPPYNGLHIIIIQYYIYKFN